MFKNIKPKKKTSFLSYFLIFVLLSVWIFSGWPKIWEKPSVPPEVKKAKAAIGDIGIWVDQNGGLDPGTTFAKFPFEGTGAR